MALYLEYETHGVFNDIVYPFLDWLLSETNYRLLSLVSSTSFFFFPLINVGLVMEFIICASFIRFLEGLIPRAREAQLSNPPHYLCQTPLFVPVGTQGSIALGQLLLQS